ncbi:MAG: hypothetical protein M3285_11910 [Actinomycetota bacterium]|nr:hypothetical protein [Actinomycetota bacterium]
MTPRNRDLRWCIERFFIEEAENTADGLEALLHVQLGFTAARMQLQMLTKELSDLITHLVKFVQDRSRQAQIQPIERDEVVQVVREAAAAITTATNDALTAPDEALRPKLEAAGLFPEEVRKCEEMRFAFSRRRRAAIGSEREALDAIVDEIAMACLTIKGARARGDVAPGMPSVEATLAAVRELHEEERWGERGVPLRSAFGALHDVTGRCQNRYVDA